MKALDSILDVIRAVVRSFMNKIARLLHSLSGGRIRPNAITLIGLAAHIPIAWLIAYGHYIPAALFLVIFGLFDALDGALARLQKSSGSAGMLLDATTDRIKEVILYCGAAVALTRANKSSLAVWAVAACGASICVSYVKAKGETAISCQKLSPNEINRLFQDGLGRFEIRMFLLIIGLISGELGFALIVITVLAAYTTLERLVKITGKLKAAK